jgi:hypothetical protein
MFIGDWARLVQFGPPKSTISGPLWRGRSGPKPLHLHTSAAQEGPATSICFYICCPGPRGVRGPPGGHRGPSVGLSGASGGPPGGPRDLRQTKETKTTRNLKACIDRAMETLFFALNEDDRNSATRVGGTAGDSPPHILATDHGIKN